jgi:hypothetical protein
MNDLVTRSASSAKLYAFTALAYAMALPGFAMAQSADFDGSTVVTKIVAYTAVGVLILGALALGRWTLRAMGIIGGK